MKGRLGRWNPYELSVVDGLGLKRCPVEYGWVMTTCEVQCDCLFRL